MCRVVIATGGTVPAVGGVVVVPLNDSKGGTRPTSRRCRAVRTVKRMGFQLGDK